jgi:hypothetical protein
VAPALFESDAPSGTLIEFADQAGACRRALGCRDPSRQRKDDHERRFRSMADRA